MFVILLSHVHGEAPLLVSSIVVGGSSFWYCELTCYVQNWWIPRNGVTLAEANDENHSQVFRISITPTNQ